MLVVKEQTVETSRHLPDVSRPGRAVPCSVRHAACPATSNEGKTWLPSCFLLGWRPFMRKTATSVNATVEWVALLPCLVLTLEVTLRGVGDSDVSTGVLQLYLLTSPLLQ